MMPYICPTCKDIGTVTRSLACRDTDLVTCPTCHGEDVREYPAPDGYKVEGDLYGLEEVHRELNLWRRQTGRRERSLGEEEFGWIFKNPPF